MKLEFSGAARGVTGSKHLLHLNGKKVLMDCGMFQGRRKQSIIANLKFPFDASKIEALVLSHAHIDHSGAIPVLVKNGFTGPIYCTHATRDLCSIMLRDSAYIQEKDAEWLRRKKKQKDAEPLYTIVDAEKALAQFRSVGYDQTFSPIPGAKVTFRDAGHILGSAVEEWEVHDNDTDQTIRFGFTGDLGRKCLPILKDPVQLENLDFLMTESTYGDRLHDEIKNVETHLAKKINETHQRGGKILIPSFAVGRTQELLYILKELIGSGAIPKIPIYVDSPMATNVTEVFALHPECFDEDLKKLLKSGQDPFCDCDGVTFTRSVDESKALNDLTGSAIIISASGMCEAGRIRHHLINCLPDPRNTILIVGFMAQNTLGRKLVEGENPVNIFGEPYEVKSEVVIYNAFSGHADQKGLLRFASGVGNAKTVFCVHGEDSQTLVFREKLKELPNLKDTKIFIPNPGDTFVLQKDKTFVKSEEVNEISRSLFLCDEDCLRVGED
jgi:metallo-beta-lactamase family protein